MAGKRRQTSGYGDGYGGLLEKSTILFMFFVLVAGVLFVLKPFVVSLLFGCILAIAAWPVRASLVKRGLSESSTALLMLIALLVFVLVPIGIAAPGLAGEVKALVERSGAWLVSSPELPAWIANLPYVGAKLSAKWQTIASGSVEGERLIASYAQPIGKFLTGAAVGLASSIVQLAISLVVATTFWSRGGVLVSALRGVLSRLGGESLAHMTIVASGAIKGVFYGIVGTAAIQGLLMTFGLMIAGIPAAVPLGFVTLLLAVSQFGSILINGVWGAAAWWLYTTSGSGLAFWFVIIWGMFVTFVDNILKPWLIGSSIDMPIMLVILGVFGGFISFGFLGLFIGPTLLAVAYALLTTWRRI